MRSTESLEPVCKGINSLDLHAQYDPKHVLLIEACAGEGKRILLGEELLDKVDIVFNSVEVVDVDPHHHVHCSTAFNRNHSGNLGEAFECDFAGSLEHSLHICEVTLWHLFQDAGQCCLDQRARVQYDHGLEAQIVDYFVEVALMVVNNGPAESPAGHAENFGK